jgi:hypothetical protein
MGARTVRLGGQRGGDHARSEIRAADPDVHHVRDALTRRAGPPPVAKRIGKARHPIQHGMDGGDHVFAVDPHHRLARRPQRHVQGRAILGDIDPLTREQSLQCRGHLPRLRQGAERSEHRRINALLGEIQINARRAPRVALRPFRLGGKQVGEGRHRRRQGDQPGFDIRHRVRHHASSVSIGCGGRVPEAGSSLSAGGS